MPDKTPLTNGAVRLAAMRLYVDIARLIHETILEKIADADPGTLTLVAAAVCIGHAECKPMSASDISNFTGIPRSTVIAKLQKLLASGQVVRIKRKYYLSKQRATSPSPELLERYAKIFLKAFEVLTPETVRGFIKRP